MLALWLEMSACAVLISPISRANVTIRDKNGERLFLRLFNRENRQMRAPQLLLIERALRRSKGKRSLFGLEGCSRQSDVEKRALSVTEIGEDSVSTGLVRMKNELRAPDKIFDPALNQPKIRGCVRVAFVNLLPPVRQTLNDEACRGFLDRTGSG